MEIEAKFTLTEIPADLKQRRELGDYTLGEGEMLHLRDTFLDTPGRRLQAAGYVFRYRQVAEGGIVLTLKGRGSVTGAVHRRSEVETRMTSWRPPQQWPDPALWEQLRQLLGSEPLLLPLFQQEQQRYVRMMRRGGRDIAELSLDRVSVHNGARAWHYCELEVELKEGSAADLAEIVASLQADYEITPMPLSKFARGWEFAERRPGVNSQAETGQAG